MISQGNQNDCGGWVLIRSLNEIKADCDMS
jgi:hypothetical protein